MTKLIHFTLVVVLVVGVVLAAPPLPAQAATTFTVNSTVDKADTNPGDGLCRALIGGVLPRCTLRAAIMETNALPGSDTINLPAGTYVLTLVGQDDTANAGDLDITGTLTLHGAGASTTIIDGNGTVTQNRVLEIISGLSTISDVTIQNGAPSGGIDGELGGGILIQADAALRLTSSTVTNNQTLFDSTEGGGIRSFGTLTVIHCVISNNTSVSGGGGISSSGPLTIGNSTISNNSAGAGGGLAIIFGEAFIFSSTITGNISSGAASGAGGGIRTNGSTTQVTIEDSTISNNTAHGSGGGISHSNGTLVVERSTLSGNTSIATTGSNKGGGGLHNNAGTVSFINSTVSGNSAKLDGGGIYRLLGTIHLASTTIANNVADSDNDNTGNGGGIFNLGDGLNTKNTLFADNLDGSPTTQHPDCSGTLTSQGFNLIESTVGCTITGDTTGNILGQDPGLGALTIFGGPTPIHMISFGPALDAGNPAGCTNHNGVLLVTDQRGVARHLGAAGGSGTCDIGSVELVQDA